MKQGFRNKKTILTHAVLASTIFCLFPATIMAFTNVGANTTCTAGTAVTGYNFTADNVTLTFDGSCPSIGDTLGTSLDNNNANNVGLCNGGACNNVVAYSAAAIGNTVFTGNIGTTNQVTTLLLDTSNTFEFDLGVSIKANIDTKTPNQGSLTFNGNNTVTGIVGVSNVLNGMDFLGGAGTIVDFQAALIKANAFEFELPATATTIIQFVDGMNFVTNSIANNTGGPSIGTLRFAGGATNVPALGITDSLFAVELAGASKTVNFSSATFNVDNLNFITPANANTQATFIDGTTIASKIDNLTGTNNIGILTFGGGGTISGDIGSTRPINLITVNNDASSNKRLTLSGALVNVATINVNDNAIGFGNGSVLKLDNAALILKNGSTNTNITATTNDTDTLDIFNANTLNANIGTSANAFHLVLVGANGDTTINGNIFATITQFQDDNTLFLGDGDIITGTVDSTSAGKGILQFQGNGTVTGDIGASNKLNVINIADGAGKIVNLQSPTLNAGSINFITGAASTSTVNLADNVDVTGNIDNTTVANGVGTVNFLGDGTVEGTIGATKTLFAVNLTGANSNVNFQDNISTTNGLNFATGSNALSFATISAGKTITGNINNTTGTNGIGNVTFLGGTNTITGNVGATNSLKSVNLITAGEILNFQGAIFNADNLNFAANADATTTVNFVNPVSIQGNIDNITLTNGNGTVNFAGNGTVSGTIGATKTLATVNLNGAGSNVNFLGNIRTNSLNFTSTATANIGNNATIIGPTTTTAINQGIVNFLGNSTIDFPMGTLALPLNQININGPSNTTVTLNNNLFASSTNVNNGGTLSVNTPETITGNLVINNGTLALGHDATPLSVTGNFVLNSNGTLQVDLANTLTSGSVIANGQAITASDANLTVLNIPAVIPEGIYRIPVITGDDTSVLYPIGAQTDRLLYDVMTEVDDINHQLDLVLTSVPLSLFANRSNTIGVAGALDNLINGNYALGGALGSLFSQLISFTDEETLNASLATLAPIVDGGIVYESFMAQKLVFGAFEDRLDKVHYGKVKAFGYAGGDFTDYADELGQGAWLKVYNEEADQHERQDIAGYHNGTWGIAAGRDLMLSEQTLVGIGLSMTGLHINHKVSDGTTRANSYQATLYGDYYFNNPLFLNWYAAAAYNRYKVDRNIVFGNTILTPEGKFNGWQIGTKGEMGYICGKAALRMVPLVSLYFSHLDLDDYKEAGAGNASQQVAAADYNMLLGGVGLKFVYDFYWDTTLVQPEAHIKVFYDFINDAMESTSNFTNIGPSFQTIGFTPARTSLNMGLSATLYRESGFVLSAYFDYDIKEDYKAHAESLRVRYEW